ncbi:MAG: glycosyltransferase family 4 protein [Firmicutes bacterium]|nr:glycosyltransferase family 4 protein [Bacillota bacterium]
MPHKVIHLLSIAAGGIYRHVFDLSQGLDRGVFSPVVVASRYNTWLDKPPGRGVKVIPLDICRRENPLLPTGDLLKLIYFFQEEKIKILHVHGFRAAFWGRVAARLAGVPVVIYTVHNFPVNRAAIVYGIEGLLANWTTHIITVSGALQGKLIQRGIPSGKVTTIHNGVKAAEVPEAIIKTKTRRYYNIGTVGRLVELKGIEYFLRAAATVAAVEPRARFYVIGDGPRRSRLQVLAHKLSLDGVVFFTGHVDNMDRWWQGLDVLVSCSLQEGLGLSILEAMAASIPVVGTRVGGIPELITNGLNGVLVRPRDSQALATAILDLLFNRDWRTSLGRRGREKVLEKFTLEKMVTAVEGIYHQSLQNLGSKVNE